MNGDPHDTSAVTSQEGVAPLQEFILEGFVPPPGWNPPRFGRPPRPGPDDTDRPADADRDTPTA